MRILDVSNDGIHGYFINNNRTAGHQLVVIGLRELSQNEPCSRELKLPPISDESFHFSTNFELLSYTSGCYYLDSMNNWQSDGLLVTFFFSSSSSFLC